MQSGDQVRVAAMPRPRFRQWLGSVAVVLLCGPAMAESGVADVRRIQSDPRAFSAAVQSGQRHATFCFNCHGEDGHSSVPDTPNLAGQNAVYLLEQIRKFATGERRDEFMQGLVKMLSDEDRLNVALYFSAQPAVPASATAGAQAAVGQVVFRKTCIVCHGEDGHGKDEIPRIAGQQPNYLQGTLKAYRAKAGDRRDPRMTAVVVDLSDDEIKALAAYVSAMK